MHFIPQHSQYQISCQSRISPISCHFVFILEKKGSRNIYCCSLPQDVQENKTLIINQSMLGGDVDSLSPLQQPQSPNTAHQIDPMALSSTPTHRRLHHLSLKSPLNCNDIYNS